MLFFGLMSGLMLLRLVSSVLFIVVLLLLLISFAFFNSAWKIEKLLHQLNYYILVKTMNYSQCKWQVSLVIWKVNLCHFLRLANKYRQNDLNSISIRLNHFSTWYLNCVTIKFGQAIFPIIQLTIGHYQGVLWLSDYYYYQYCYYQC